MAVIDVPRRAERRSALLFLMPILVLGFLWVASGIAVPPWLAPRSAQLQGLVTTFLGIFIEALPFLLAGVVTSILIGAFVTPAWLASVLPRSAFGATVSGALLGLLFPVCECGAIPTSRRLMRKGAPASLGIAFALAAPVVNPIVLISTTVAIGAGRRRGWACLPARPLGAVSVPGKALSSGSNDALVNRWRAQLTDDSRTWTLLEWTAATRKADLAPLRDKPASFDGFVFRTADLQPDEVWLGATS